METRYYIVVGIDGDYANLKMIDIERALLPEDIKEGSNLFM